jgi:hypothetical protein
MRPCLSVCASLQLVAGHNGKIPVGAIGKSSECGAFVYTCSYVESLFVLGGNVSAD